MSHRIRPAIRRLEAAFFICYALCSVTDQLLSTLGDWIRKAIRTANDRVAASRPDRKAQLRDFATAVKTLAGNKDLTRDALVKQLCELADAALEQDVPSRTSLMRTQLVSKRRVARALLAKLLDLPFQAQAAHPVMDALVLLGKLYANKAVGLPPDTGIPLGRAWQRMIAGENRGDALIAFEWATLFALRVALRNGSVYVEHSFSFRSLGMLLIHSNNS